MNAAARALRSYGAGAGASRLLAGGLRCHRRLEQRLSHWLGVEDVVVTTSGYQANLATLVALAGATEDVIIVDRLAHASTYDGLRLSAGSMLRFGHNDVADLDKKLRMSVAARRKIVCVESVYSMDGDEAPLREIAALCRQHKALLVVDEDHAIGVIGEGGCGLCAELGVQPDVLLAPPQRALVHRGDLSPPVPILSSSSLTAAVALFFPQHRCRRRWVPRWPASIYLRLTQSGQIAYRRAASPSAKPCAMPVGRWAPVARRSFR